MLAVFFMLFDMDDSDEKWFAWLFGAYYDRIFHFLWYSLSQGHYNTALAHDFAQETFEEAYRQREKLRAYEEPVGWLIETAKNKCRRITRDDYTKINPLAIDDPKIVPLIPPVDSAQDTSLLMYRMMLKMNKSFTKEEYAMFEKRFLLNESLETLAAEFDLTVPALKMRLGRLKAKAKKIIFEENF